MHSMLAGSAMRALPRRAALVAGSRRSGMASAMLVPACSPFGSAVAADLQARSFFFGARSADKGSSLLDTPTARAALNATQFHAAPGTQTSAAASPLSPNAGSSLPPPPVLPPKKKRRGFFRRVGRLLALVTLAGAGSFAYFVHESNNPPNQLPLDPSKKTIVILGSGWGATALLKEIDNTEYNIVVIGKTNYFLYTPLLPQVTVGTISPRSIAQPTRHNTRYKTREVQVLEAEATKINAADKTVEFEDVSNIYGLNNGSVTTIPYDYLVVAVGSQNQTFGMKGVDKNAFFLKELSDATKIRSRIMDLIEKASLVGQSEEEIDRLLHLVVVGGGPTGVEFAGECHDFIQNDLSKWYPQVANRVRVTLVEALPKILPMFSKDLVEYTENMFKSNKITIMSKHQVCDLDEEKVTMKNPSGEKIEVPCGMLVWAAGNTSRPISRDLQTQLKDKQTDRRGLKIDEHLRLLGAEDSIFAIGDATATQWAPTAQAASQQGKYLAKVFEQLATADKLDLQAIEAKKNGADASEVARLERRAARAAAIKPFQFVNNGVMASIGADRAIADVPIGGGATVSAKGTATYLLWRSAYLSMLFSLRNRTQVALNWIQVWTYGRDLSRE